MGPSFYDYLIAFCIIIPFVILILSIPSFYQFYKKGLRKHLTDIRILYKLSKELGICYKLKTKQNIQYNYGNGNSKVVTQDNITYYFPIYKNNNNVYIIEKEDIVFSPITISHYTYKDKKWQPVSINLPTNPCLYYMLFKERMDTRLKGLMKDSINLDDVDNLNELINSEIVSIRRESKLNQLI